jgi:YfiH family protein|tara:strand:- start:905 stop:1675 length:771 start_codon:yes stop_codon:yes gene_type:complete
MFYSKNLKKNNKIQHCFFSRNNGVSNGIYKSLNCGPGSKDKKENIEKNLNIVSKEFQIEKKSLILMHQTHSNKVKIINNDENLTRVDCDAMLTKSDKIALSVLTADCIPILMYEKKNKIIGCIHAGWKGAISGIIENTLKKIIEMNGEVNELTVSIGPCISQENYEVKNDFYSKFKQKSDSYESFFLKKNDETLNFDLRGFVNKKFIDLGVLEIENIFIDTFASKNEYFSHRRAKKMGEDDYGRCISVIKKINLQN